MRIAEQHFRHPGAGEAGTRGPSPAVAIARAVDSGDGPRIAFGVRGDEVSGLLHWSRALAAVARDLLSPFRRAYLVPRVSLIPSIALALLPVTALAAQTRALCFDAPFTESARAFVSNQDGPKPHPLTRVDLKSGPVSSSKLLSYLRSLKGDWRTPDGIWSKSGNRVTISEKGIETCDVIVDRMNRFALINKDTGFVVYGLSPPENLEFVRLTDLRNVVR